MREDYPHLKYKSGLIKCSVMNHSETTSANKYADMKQISSCRH